jgi:hypothetical protein
LLRALQIKAAALPGELEGLRYAVGAREAVDGDADVLAITAADIFTR